MRLAALSLSAVLLSGCSWLGGITSPGKATNYEYGKSAHNQANSGRYHPQGPHNQLPQVNARGAQNPCVIYSPVQPVPTGCDSSQVKLAGGQGYNSPQQTNYATGGYGSHASSAHQVPQKTGSSSRLKKPRLRGSMSFGVDKNVAGTIADFSVPAMASTVAYDPALFEEVLITPNGTGEDWTTYSSVVEAIRTPTLSVGDVHRAPTRLAAGLEFIASPHFTVFANGGYTHAPGVERAPVTVQASLSRTIENYDAGGALTSTPQTTLIPNQDVAHLYYDFNDQQKFDVEVGARHYFNPIIKDQGHRTLTPFVGASAGIAHVNEVEFKTEQDQLFLENAFENNVYNYYDPAVSGAPTRLYDSDWLATGGVQAGLEWQVTPKAALAFETGLKYTQGRDYVTGEPGTDTFDVPLTLRGSFNF